jgi:hypothetical protein
MSKINQHKFNTKNKKSVKNNVLWYAFLYSIRVLVRFLGGR